LNRTESWYHARPLRAARAVFLAVVLPLALTACAETTQGPLAGASDAWASAPEPTSPSSASSSRSSSARAHGAPWQGYDEVVRTPLVTSAPFASRGHLPEQSVEVRANDVARGPYAALVADTVFPEGSLLAELSPNASGNGYVMRKSAGAWSYFELDVHGNLLASGTPAHCAGCHSQALSDHVFGLPRTALNAP